MKPLIIFGAGDFAQIAHFYFKRSRKYRVQAFVVDDAFIKEKRFDRLPVVGMSQIGNFSPRKYSAFVAVGYSRMNSVRQKKYEHLKSLGYTMASYISPECVCLTDDIGDNCFILEDNTIQPFVKIGNNVTLWSGNHIGHHAEIGDHCFIASHVVVSGRVKIENNCFVGVNAAIYDHVLVRQRTLIGAGALVAKDTEEGAVYKSAPTATSVLKSGQLKGF